jgi:hypothetical protein
MKRTILVVSVTLLGILVLSGVLICSKPVHAQAPSTPTTIFWLATTCSANASGCHSTITIPNGGFADSNYVIACTVDNYGATALGVYDKTAKNFVLYVDVIGGLVPAGTVAGCIAMHS